MTPIERAELAYVALPVLKRHMGEGAAREIVREIVEAADKHGLRLSGDTIPIRRNPAKSP